MHWRVNRVLRCGCGGLCRWVLKSPTVAGLDAVPILRLAFVVRMTSSGPVLYGLDRLGPRNSCLRGPRFAVCVGTPAVAMHVSVYPEKHRTRTGNFLH